MPRLALCAIDSRRAASFLMASNFMVLFFTCSVNLYVYTHTLIVCVNISSVVSFLYVYRTENCNQSRDYTLPVHIIYVGK